MSNTKILRLGQCCPMYSDIDTVCQELITGGYHTTQFYIGGHAACNIPTLIAGDYRHELGAKLRANDFRINVHAPHSVNLGKVPGSKGDVSVRVINQLQYEIRDLPAQIVVHMGKVGVDNNIPDSAKAERIGQHLNSPKRVKGSDLLLENAAGQGSEYGTTVQHMRQAFEALDSTADIFICIDTQHSYASGLCSWDSPDTVSRCLESFDAELPNKIRTIHLNDSAKAFGSRVDRHAPLGTGFIWTGHEDALYALLNRAIDNKWDVITETSDFSQDFKFISQALQ